MSSSVKKEEQEQALQEAQQQEQELQEEEAQTNPLQALGDAAMDPKEREKILITTRNAVNNAALRFGESVTTFPERIDSDAAKGEDIGDPNYQPEWNPIGDFIEFRGGYAPVRTWWGNIAEELAYYGSYGVEPHCWRCSRWRFTRCAGASMGSAALAALVSKQHDDHNLSGKIVERVPEMGIVLGPLATQDEDHPLLKKTKERR